MIDEDNARGGGRRHGRFPPPAVNRLNNDGKFHLFHQVLGWSSCLRSATNRQVVVRPGRIVSPDLRFAVSSYTYPHHYVLR